MSAQHHSHSKMTCLRIYVLLFRQTCKWFSVTFRIRIRSYRTENKKTHNQMVNKRNSCHSCCSGCVWQSHLTRRTYTLALTWKTSGVFSNEIDYSFPSEPGEIDDSIRTEIIEKGHVTHCCMSDCDRQFTVNVRNES